MLFGQHIHVSGRKKKRVIDYSNIHISTAPLFFTSALQAPQPLSVTRPRSAVADKTFNICKQQACWRATVHSKCSTL